MGHVTDSLIRKSEPILAAHIKIFVLPEHNKSWWQILTIAGTWSHKNMCGCRNYNYTVSYDM
jgi:hypothetical protein